jgi:preprotein translocase subunit SecG
MVRTEENGINDLGRKEMRAASSVVGVLFILLAGLLVLPVMAQEKKTESEKKAVEPAKAKGEGEPAKAKAEKVSGDIGLLDTEKNYMIVVTKEGKLITLDFNTKTKVTEMKETKVKMGDVGLGSSANVEYITKGEKNFLTKMTFVPAKGE